MSSCPTFSFSHLSPTAQLGMASHMSSQALHEFASCSPPFSAFLALNESAITLACLRTQYGYIPPHRRRASLTMLAAHEPLPPNAARFLALLSSRNTPNTLFTPAEHEALYGPGVRGLLRYLDYRRRRASPSAFLARSYTTSGLAETIAVYEILCDIIAARLGGIVPFDELPALQASLIASLDILEMPAQGEGDINQWLASRRPTEKFEDGDSFFITPSKEASELQNDGCAIVPSDSESSNSDSAVDMDSSADEEENREKYVCEPYTLEMRTGGGSGTSSEMGAYVPRFMERVVIGEPEREGVLRRWGTRLTRGRGRSTCV
ncbi:hypothetical protein EDC01DRAFT_635569 [Geopyxis carbonaria]|nr:hypothetical protein EDC01DRAFT_635569 [Geopyxis carbonaria]